MVPLRFERAVTGQPRRDAPWPDDRGWRIARPSGFNATEARGPLFGVLVDDTVRLKVTREDLDPGAALYATVSESAEPQIEVVEPAAGEPIPASGILKIKGIADTSSGQTLEIRLGAADGPVIAEAEPHVFSRLTLNLTPHAVRIHSAAAAPGTGTVPATDAQINAAFSIARAIWRPAGVTLNVGAIRRPNLYGAPRDNTAYDRTTATNRAAFGNVFGLGRVPSTINVYFVGSIEGSLGLGIRRETTNAGTYANRTGILLAVRGGVTISGASTHTDWVREETGNALTHVLGNDLAHEIGHILTLAHSHNVHGWPGRKDTYSRQMLMHPQPYLPRAADEAAVRRDDVGAGRVPRTSNGVVNQVGIRGSLITLKAFDEHSTDGEVKAARARFSHADLYS